MPVRKQPWSRIVIFSTLWIRTLRLREPVGLYASIEWYKWVYNPKLGPQFVILPIELQSLSHLKGLNYNTNKKQQQKHAGPLSAGFRVRIATQARHMGSWPRGDSGKTYLIFSVSFYIQPLHLRLVSVQLGPKKEKQEKKKSLWLFSLRQPLLKSHFSQFHEQVPEEWPPLAAQCWACFHVSGMLQDFFFKWASHAGCFQVLRALLGFSSKTETQCKVKSSWFHSCFLQQMVILPQRHWASLLLC